MTFHYFIKVFISSAIIVLVSEIAKRFGGGGHRKAAGFVLPKSKHPDSIFISEIVEDEDSFVNDHFGAD